MRRFGLFLGGLLLVLIGASWLLPRHLDWDDQRGRLAALAAGQLGRPVALQGPLRVTLLPQPMVEADDVIVGGGADDLRLTARSLRLRLDLPALLRLRLAPREVVLVGAELRLPWPPATTPALRPPPWLTAFDARIEQSRVLIGDAVLDGVSARLNAGGLLEAVRAEGSFAWRGTTVSFRAVVGRPGFDGIATLDLTLAAAGASATARGLLVEEGGFDGRVEAQAPDLAAFAGTPPGALRLSGGLNITGETLTAQGVELEFAGVPARGAAVLRLAQSGPRLELAVQASRLDLDAWLGAIRAAPEAPMPIAMEIAAETASFRGIALRRVRAGVFREGERVTLSDVALLLPGELEVELEGATAGGRLELAARFTGANLRDSLAALGVSLDGVEPARLRRIEGRARIAITETEIAVTELTTALDDMRIAGAGVLRRGARPALGLGLELDRLDLDGLLPALEAALADPASLGFDANLRLAAERVTLRGVALERAALDAAFEGGRLAVRRLGFRGAGADLAFSGTLGFGATPRLADASLDVTAADATALLALLPSGWGSAPGFGAQPLALRLTGGGAPDAIAINAVGEIGDLRIAAEGTIDALQRRVAGALTLRHPGAPRLLSLLRGHEAPPWLGAGSFSLIATVAANADGIAAEQFTLVAGALRAGGRGAIAAVGGRPRLSGRIQAETLPLPDPFADSAAPLGLDQLAALDAEVTLEAARVTLGERIVLSDLRAGIVLAGGTLRIAVPEARLSGGRIEGEARVEGSAVPPRVVFGARLADVTLAAELVGLPIDLTAGVLEGSVDAAGSGHSLAGLIATLSGTARLSLRDGVLRGLDAAALPAAADIAEPAAAEAALRAALAGGATAFDRLEAAIRLESGRAVVNGTRMVVQGGALVAIDGAIDLARGSFDLGLRVAMPGDAPDIGLRLTGLVGEPRRLPDLSPWLRWRAER